MAAARGLYACRHHRKFYAGLAGELIAWARHQFELDLPDDDGVSARTHIAGALARAQKESRRRMLAAELAGPPFPRPLRYLWALFVEISDGTASDGPAIVTWGSLLAWSQCTGVVLEPREAGLLVHLGAVRADVIALARLKKLEKKYGHPS